MNSKIHGVWKFAIVKIIDAKLLVVTIRLEWLQSNQSFDLMGFIFDE